MGYTPAGGIPMGTRSGDLDPGVMLELAQRYDPEELRDMVFYQMGLIALSDGESGEHCPDIRAAICGPLAFMGFAADTVANQSGLPRIGRAGSKPILVIPADEEKMIYGLCLGYLDQRT